MFRTERVDTLIVVYSEVCWDTLFTSQPGRILLSVPCSRIQHAVELARRPGISTYIGQYHQHLNERLYGHPKRLYMVLPLVAPYCRARSVRR